MELQPLHDTAGTGLSLLDTILHTRVAIDGVVNRTVSRVLYVCKYSPGASPQALCEKHAHLLSDADPEATGFLLVQPNSFWGCLESSPETVAELFRWIDTELGPRLGDGSIRSCRIVAQIEDCPTRAFCPWNYRSLVLPSEAGAIDLDSQAPIDVCAALFQTAMNIGKVSLDFGPSALDALHERIGSALPSDERVCALSEWGKLTSCREWLDIFDSAPSFPMLNEDVFPLI